MEAMAATKCSECGAEMSDRVANCPVCGAPLTSGAAQRVATALRVLKRDKLRGFGAAVAIFGAVVLLSEGSPTFGTVALGLGLVLCILGSAGD